MNKPRVYLDTTVPSAILDSRVPDRQRLTKEFWESASDRYSLFVSAAVLKEVAQTPDAVRRSNLEALLAKVPLLDITEACNKLAEQYVVHGAIPRGFTQDALHISVATVHGCDIVASWNFRHMVKLKTQHLVSAVNELTGYRVVEIVTPAQL